MYRRFVHLSVGLTAVITLALAWTVPPALAMPQEDEPQRDPEAVEIMKRADAALAAVGAFEFDFERTGTHGSTGRTSGHAIVERTANFVDMRYRGRIDVHVPSPATRRLGGDVEVASDGERIWLLDHGDRTLYVGATGGGAGTMTIPPGEFLLPFMIRPLQGVEIDLPERMSLAGRADVGGVECDVVYLDFPDDSGFGEQYFYVGRDDHLPRRVVLVASGANGSITQFDFSLTDLKVIEPRVADFHLDAPSGYAVNEDALALAPGAVAESWEMTTPEGDVVRLEDLRGKVVVLDFWASWCPICRTQLPMVSQVADQMRELPVEFFGVNVWESGDPLAFLDEVGATIPVFLEADDLAARYRVAGTGTLVIIGPDGRFLPRMYGNTTQESLTEAIHSVLPGAGRDTRPAASEPDDS